MAKENFIEFDATAGSNVDIDSISVAEGMVASDVNNAFRALMALTKEFYTSIGGGQTTGGSSNTYTLTSGLGGYDLTDGTVLSFSANHSCTGASTLNVDSTGAKAIKVFDSAESDTATGDIISTGHYWVQYDSALDGGSGAWVLMNPSIPDAIVYLSNVVEDTTPQWGGDLDANGFDLQFDDATGIRDDSDNEQLIFQKTASAVTYWEMTNAATGNGPLLQAVGEANTDALISPSGSGDIVLGGPVRSDTDATDDLGSATYRWQDLYLSGNLQLEDTQSIVDANGNSLVQFRTTASAVNGFEVRNQATGGTPKLSTVGSDTNISFIFAPKGSGVLRFDTGEIRGHADDTTQLGSASFRYSDFHLARSQYVYEQASAPSGVSNCGVIFTEDNGAGKTRLMVQFGSGSAQQIAIEP